MCSNLKLIDDKWIDSNLFYILSTPDVLELYILTRAIFFFGSKLKLMSLHVLLLVSFL